MCRSSKGTKRPSRAWIKRACCKAQMRVSEYNTRRHHSAAPIRVQMLLPFSYRA